MVRHKYYLVCLALTGVWGSGCGGQPVTPQILVSTPTVSAFEQFKIVRQTFPEHQPEVSVLAVGDVMLSRGVAKQIQRTSVDYPYALLAEALHSGDIVFGNLETPIQAGYPVEDASLVFRADPGVEQGAAQAGFNILSVANNHSMNQGWSGLDSTLSLLQQAGIQAVGGGSDPDSAEAPVYTDKLGIRFAFLAYTDTTFTPDTYEASAQHGGLAFMQVDDMTKAVQEAKQHADVVLVSMHAGTEYTQDLTQPQIDFAHAAIDAGADVVLGQHPHVLQQVEEYKGKYIFYSLGNFVFDQQADEATRDSVLLKLVFSATGLERIEYLPIHISDTFQPEITADPETVTNILDRLKAPTALSAVRWSTDSQSYVVELQPGISVAGPESEANLFSHAKGDIDQDGKPETYTLLQGVLSVQEDGLEIWHSSADWWVDQFALADSTGDGQVDLNLSVWRSGNFGSSKPKWVKENDLSVKNHFFVFDLTENQIQAVWQSSNLDRPNCDFRFSDLNQDGVPELIVTEGEYTDDFSCQGTSVAVWQWGIWGFENEWRSEPGQYQGLEAENPGLLTRVVFESL